MVIPVPTPTPNQNPLSSVGMFRNRVLDRSFLPGATTARDAIKMPQSVVDIAKASNGRVRLAERPLASGMDLREETQRKFIETTQKQSQQNVRRATVMQAQASLGSPTIGGHYHGHGGNIPKGLVAVGGGQYLRADAARGFAAMNQAFKKAFGYALTVNSGYRSVQEQARLYNDYKSGRSSIVAAAPGHSNHNHGTAVDLGGWGGSTSSAQFRWLLANAHRFGFSWAEGRAVNEPWHWVYVGGR